jgi:probable phosphoglycerate mutase
MAVAHYLGLPLDLYQRLSIGPASVTAFTFTPFGPRLLVLNSAESLPSLKFEDKEQAKEDKGQEKEELQHALPGV